MNKLECEVVEILSEPIYKKVEGQEWWEVIIKINDYGKIDKDKEIFNNKKEAEKISVGDKVWR